MSVSFLFAHLKMSLKVWPKLLSCFSVINIYFLKYGFMLSHVIFLHTEKKIEDRSLKLRHYKKCFLFLECIFFYAYTLSLWIQLMIAVSSYTRSLHYGYNRVKQKRYFMEIHINKSGFLKRLFKGVLSAFLILLPINLRSYVRSFFKRFNGRSPKKTQQFCRTNISTSV